MDDKQKADIIKQVTDRCTAEGKLIEAGWQAMRLLVVSPDADLIQLSEMRKVFFAGAQHLFASIMLTLDGDDDREPTSEDLQRMDLINDELNAFADELRAEVNARRRSAR